MYRISNYKDLACLFWTAREFIADTQPVQCSPIFLSVMVNQVMVQLVLIIIRKCDTRILYEAFEESSPQMAIITNRPTRVCHATHKSTTKIRYSWAQLLVRARATTRTHGGGNYNNSSYRYCEQLGCEAHGN